jgi:hypothetical protein
VHPVSRINALASASPSRVVMKLVNGSGEAGPWMYARPKHANRPTSFRSPWQNGYVERLIRSIRP